MQRPGFVLAAALLTFPALVAGCDSKPSMTQEEIDAKFAREIKDAEARIRNNKVAEANKILTRLLEERPGDPDATALMGKVLFQKENYAEAQSLLTTAAAAKPDDAEIHAMLGEVLKHAKKPAESAASYQKAFKLDGENSSYGLSLGGVLLEAGKAKEAEAVLREVAELDPQVLNEARVGVHTLIGDALRAQEKLEPALAAYMKGQSINKSDKMAIAGAAFVYEAKEDIKHARDQWSYYIQRDCCSDYSKTVAQKKLTELQAHEADG